jgi:hypothetical protein
MGKERKRPHLGDQVLLHHSSEREGDPVDVTLQGHLHLSLGGLPLLMTSDSDGWGGGLWCEMYRKEVQGQRMIMIRDGADDGIS